MTCFCNIPETEEETTRTNFHFDLKPARSHKGIVNEVWPVSHTCKDRDNEQMLTPAPTHAAAAARVLLFSWSNLPSVLLIEFIKQISHEK